MFFSQKYPEIMASIEEKLQKQVEDKGLDFETVRKDVEDGLKYEIEFYGIAGFGSSYALMRTPGRPPRQGCRFPYPLRRNIRHYH